MTELMLPLLEKVAPDAQVITVSFAGMYTSPLTTDLEVNNSASFEHLENYLNFLFVVLKFECSCLQYSDADFEGVEQYARNKRVQVSSITYSLVNSSLFCIILFFFRALLFQNT